jgi:hypothetical protein
MAVKISKLFGDTWFQAQSPITKLLYIYLISNPNLNTVGVLSPNLQVVGLETGFTLDELREATKVLVQKKYLYVEKFDDVVYFIIPSHFSSIPKSESSVMKVQKVLQSLPEGLVTFLKSVGITINSKVREFVKPTPEQVTEYCLSLGYVINGKDFVSYYEGQSDRYGKKGIWVDTRGTQVRDWKAKARRVWCKEENKLKVFKDAPKGFETFFVLGDSDEVQQPDGWRNGKPFHKSIGIDIALKKEYGRTINIT